MGNPTSAEVWTPFVITGFVLLHFIYALDRIASTLAVDELVIAFTLRVLLVGHEPLL